ncbi:MAG: hypothetical protein KH230_00805 [Enterocloster asparagiformis]|nr:hypothetical protein [Enterocloster asparagiformis]
MRRGVLFVCAAALALALAGCGNSKELEAENASLSAKVGKLSDENESLEDEKKDLQEALEKAEEEKKSAEEQLSAVRESVLALEAEKTVQEGDVTVLLVNKGESPKDVKNWVFNSRCTFEFLVTNNTDKDIQGVEGALKLMDLFGKEIQTVGCDFTGRIIPAHDSLTVDTLSLEVNEYMDEDVKLYNTKFADLKSEYTVTKIVFTDGTEKE